MKRTIKSIMSVMVAVFLAMGTMSTAFALEAEKIDIPELTPDYTNDLFISIEERYAMLQEGLRTEGFGNIGEVKIPEAVGYSQDIEALFFDYYGDINKTSLQTQGIPESFDVEKMQRTATSLREQALGDFKSSESYKRVINSVSIGNVFDAAISAVESPALLTSDEMSNLLNSTFSSVDDKSASNTKKLDSSEYKDLVEKAKIEDSSEMEKKWYDLTHSAETRGF